MRRIISKLRNPLRSKLRRRRGRVTTRRGISSILAMMFLVIFGSLVAAMAVASNGNIRTASTHLNVVKSMSAAETGLRIGVERLDAAARRFVVAESEIDPPRATALWDGIPSGIGAHRVISPPPAGYAESSAPNGIAEVLLNHHDADQFIINGLGFPASASIGPADPEADPSIYRTSGWVVTPAVAVEPETNQTRVPPAYQIRYAPLADGETIRVIADGYVFDPARANRPFRRTLTQDVRIVRRVEHALVTPARVLIGKNVRIDGDIASGFDQTNLEAGAPIVSRDDFLGLDPTLDGIVTDFQQALALHDLDADARLRIGHPVEGLGIPGPDDYDGDGIAEMPFIDATRDGFLDSFDLFLGFFDTDGDGRIRLADDLVQGTPAEFSAGGAEFTDGDGFAIDPDLAILIDSAQPDRNRNGVFGFQDLDFSGDYDPRYDQPLDQDPGGFDADVELGWRDGWIDGLDNDAKIQGTITFTTNDITWTDAGTDFQDFLDGSVRPDADETPVIFGADPNDIPLVDADSFNTTEARLEAAADGADFWDQVAQNLGVATATLSGWTILDNPGDPTLPAYEPVDPDTDFDGLPDNHDVAHFEPTPYGESGNFNDLYYRPVFHNMIFKDAVIPLGLNALFNNCEFIGVTRVMTHADNSHPLWGIYGRMEYDSVTKRPVPAGDYEIYGDGVTETAAAGPPSLPASALPPAQTLRLKWDAGLGGPSPIDKGDVPAFYVPLVIGYADLPEPLVINGRRVEDTRAFSNNLRLHDCLVVGSIVTDPPIRFEPIRNKLQFTGATTFAEEHPEYPLDPTRNPEPIDEKLIASSSLMAPDYSVDLGAFNAPKEQNIALRGAIVAGVIDMRGNASIHGALLTTFDPRPGVPPLADAMGNPLGNPAAFNVSLGYFGEFDGDLESIDPATLPTVDGEPIIGWELGGETFPPDEYPGVGAVAIPFNGFGRILIMHDPELVPPPGIWLPLSTENVTGSYREGDI